MKKIFIALSCVLLLASCAKEPSVGEKEAAIYREFAKRIQEAQSIEDIAQLQNEGGFYARIAELAPEWRALIVDGDSSAYYAELEKTQPAKDSLKMLTDIKMAECFKKITYK